MSAYDKALVFTIDPSIEGGLVDLKLDRGGRTNHGVTQTEYDSWRARHGMRTRAVDLIGEDELRALYFEDYWVPCRCEELPVGLGAAVFDMAVNSGETNASLTLQAAVSAKRDGKIGDLTIAAANRTPDAVLRYLHERARFFAECVEKRPAEVDFLHGWINRLLNFQDAFHKGSFA